MSVPTPPHPTPGQFHSLLSITRLLPASKASQGNPRPTFDHQTPASPSTSPPYPTAVRPGSAVCPHGRCSLPCSPTTNRVCSQSTMVVYIPWGTHKGQGLNTVLAGARFFRFLTQIF